MIMMMREGPWRPQMFRLTVKSKKLVFLCREYNKSAMTSQCEFSPNTRTYHLKPERNN